MKWKDVSDARKTIWGQRSHTLNGADMPRKPSWFSPLLPLLFRPNSLELLG